MWTGLRQLPLSAYLRGRSPGNETGSCAECYSGTPLGPSSEMSAPKEASEILRVKQLSCVLEMWCCSFQFVGPR